MVVVVVVAAVAALLLLLVLLLLLQQLYTVLSHSSLSTSVISDSVHSQNI